MIVQASDPCPQRDGTLPHCVHDNGHPIMTNPPINVLVCCYCNNIAHERREPIVVDLTKHGPHHPRR